MTNGGIFLLPTDGRSREARRFRDVHAELINHLGGEAKVTETRRHLVKRATALIISCERAEAKLAAGEDLPLGPYVNSVNALRRLMVDLGLEEKPIEVYGIDLKKLTDEQLDELERLVKSFELEPEPDAVA